MLLTELKNPIPEINPIGELNVPPVQRVMSTVARRLLAGMWFALAAVVPAAYYFSVAPMFGGRPMTLDNSLAVIVAISIIVSSVCGLTIGAGILDAAVIKSPFQAVRRGLIIGLVCYLILYIELAVVLAVSIDDLVILILLEAIVFLYGLLCIGWLPAAVGAAAAAGCRMWRSVESSLQRQVQRAED